MLPWKAAGASLGPPPTPKSGYVLVWAFAATVLWLLTTFGWWRARKAERIVPKSGRAQDTRQLSTATTDFRGALRAGDARAVARAICQLAEVERPGSARNLRYLAGSLTPDAAGLMQQLDQLIYADGAKEVPPVLSDALRSKLSAGMPWRVMHKDDTKGTGLPSLFPVSAEARGTS